jgi:DNA-binding NtrC family response regulator
MEAGSVLRDVLVSLFRSEGIDVVVCSSLSEIWSTIDVGSSDLAIVDVWFESPRGITYAQQQALRAIGDVIPLVVLTEETAVGESCQAAIGAVTLLPKPFDIEVVFETVARCIRARNRSTSA